MALPLVTQSELATRIADSTGYSLVNVKDVLKALDAIVPDAMSNCERIRVGGVTVEPKMRKAQGPRKGRNPQTGDPVHIPKKGASVSVKARVAKRVKDAAPSVQLLRRRLG